MPVYVYEIILKNGKAGKQFEVMQNMSDPALTHDPKSGKPVRRVFSAPNLPQSRYDKEAKKLGIDRPYPKLT